MIPKIRIHKVNGKWRVHHEFCNGIRDTIVDCATYDDAWDQADYHVWWHSERGKRTNA